MRKRKLPTLTRDQPEVTGVDIEVTQELMQHTSSLTALDVYTRAVDQQKREASLKVVELMLPMEVLKLQHPSAPSPTSLGSSQKSVAG